MSKVNDTRRRIIAAAVKQIAGEDIYHRLRLERIAEKAGVSEATIRYHFKTKEDFSKAVWQGIIEERKPYCLTRFYEEHKELLKDRAGQREFIHQMLINYAAFFRMGKSKSYRRLLRIFFIENIGSDNGLREHVEQNFLEDFMMFHRICKEISGIDDKNYSSMLFLFTMQPLAYSYIHLVGVRSQEKSLNRARHEMIILLHAEHSLLYHLGLIEDGPALVDARNSERYS